MVEAILTASKSSEKAALFCVYCDSANENDAKNMMSAKLSGISDGKSSPMGPKNPFREASTRNRSWIARGWMRAPLRRPPPWTARTPRSN